MLLPTDPAPAGERGPAGDRRRALTALVLGLLPALAAIWGVRWFVTQDGSAHLYNAHILVHSFDAQSPFEPFYTVRWGPLPNWSGHIVSAAFVAILPVWAAGPAATTLTLGAFAASIVWLRVRVSGWRGAWLAALIAALLGLNFPWLLGFTSFLLGACLFPVTLGVWWAGRDQLGWRRVLALGLLVVLGYFSHLVSLGLTAIALVVLALLTPGPRYRERLLRTALALSPLIPLGLVYLSIATRREPMSPDWKHLTRPLSIASWGAQLGWVDPITLARKTAIPFTRIDDARWFALFTPLTWLVLAFVAIWYAAVRRPPSEMAQAPNERRGWSWLAALFLVGGIVGPDSLGSAHGEYLPQRVLLMGLVALVPALRLDGDAKILRMAGAALTVALTVQSAIVWDYALTSHRLAGAIAAARDAIGTRQRVATLLIDIRTRFRANSLLHADNLLGVGTGNIIWNNYETVHYYFPVQFRPGVDRPISSDLEQVAITEGAMAAGRARLWRQAIEPHLGAIDAVLVWGTDAELDAINARWFKTVYNDPTGRVRVLRPRE